MEGGKREPILPRKLGYGNHDAGSFIPEGIVHVFGCELHNDDVLTEFKKPLPPKKILERTTVDRGIIPCQTMLQSNSLSANGLGVDHQCTPPLGKMSGGVSKFPAMILRVQ
jgi:hypothetical protein